MTYIMVGIGGIIGSLLRYFLTVMAKSLFSDAFPFGTLAANLTGAFLLGWVTKRLSGSNSISPSLVRAIGTGMIGSYTTFSTFSMETIAFVEQNRIPLAFAYLGASFAGGLLCGWLGFKLGAKRMFREKANLL